MISLIAYGFRSRAAFLRAKGISRETFDALAAMPWPYQKSALLHPECPLDIRDRFAADRVWYKRLVALFNNAAPADYWRKAEGETDRVIRKAYLSNLEFFGKKVS